MVPRKKQPALSKVHCSHSNPNQQQQAAAQQPTAHDVGSSCHKGAPAIAEECKIPA